MTKFKVGDKVKIVKGTAYYEQAPDEIGKVISDTNSDGWTRVQFLSFANNYDELELVNSITLINMSLIDKVKALTKTEPEKSLYKANLTDINDNLTEDGKAILNQILFEANKAKLAEIAKDLIKDESKN